MFRKYFEDLSLVEGVLILSAFFFAVFLRFYNLDVQSAWTNELASWYYLRHLDEVFLYESHSPAYYGLLRVFLGEEASLYAIRFFSAFLSLLHFPVLYFLGKKFMDTRKVVALLILLALNPADIVYARMARHYSLLMEGTLLFLFMVKARVRTSYLSAYAFFLGFVHVFALIPMAVIMLFHYFGEKDLKKCLIVISSSFGIVFYYFLRLFFLGSGRVGGNVSWNNSEFPHFFKYTLAQFFGDAYPRTMVFPPDFVFVYGALTLVFAFILWRRKQSGLLLLIVWVSSLLFIEFVNLFWINLRINRYVIYLTGLLLYAFIDSFREVNSRKLLLIFSASLLIVVKSEIISYFPWDDESVTEWRRFRDTHPSTPFFICSNKFQHQYYGLQSGVPCGERIGEVDIRSPLLFFDLNNNDRMVTLYLMEKMRPVSYRNLPHSTIIHFIPR